MAAKKKGRRKGPVRKAKRGRTATQNRTGNAAWKAAERKLARYFGVERVGLGRAGHDLSEAPEVAEWLQARAPELYDPGALEPFSHICADSKCDKRVLPLLERWHDHYLARPDKDYLIPLGVIGTIPEPDDGGLIVCTRLEHFHFAYRALLSPLWPIQDTFRQFLHRFYVWRHPRGVNTFVKDAFAQVEDAARGFATQRLSPVRILPLVYLSYPKRISDAVCFKLPAEAVTNG